MGASLLQEMEKPVLQFVGEEIPDLYRNLIAAIIIPKCFPKNELGAALDTDLNNSEHVMSIYGLTNVDEVVCRP